MPKFRKKSVVIEALQVPAWNEEGAWHRLSAWLHRGDAHWRVSGTIAGLIIITLEGEMHAGPGDWIIRGVKGEFYPCRPSIFEATYEPA